VIVGTAVSLAVAVIVTAAYLVTAEIVCY
jgi:hypothetical protein